MKTPGYAGFLLETLSHVNGFAPEGRNEQCPILGSKRSTQKDLESF